MSTDHEAGIAAAAQTLLTRYKDSYFFFQMNRMAWESVVDRAVTAYLDFRGISVDTDDLTEARDRLQAADLEVERLDLVIREASALIYAMSPGKARELLETAL